MARKRQKKDKKKKEIKEPKLDTPNLTDLKKMFPVNPLSTFEGNQFKELAQLSNTAAAMMKDVNEKEIMAFRLRAMAKKIKSGEIKPPLLQEVLPKLYAQYTDMDKAHQIISENAKSLDNTAQFALGQLGHRYEEYVDALIRFRNRLNGFIGEAKLKTVSHHRTDKESDTKQGEIFDKGFEDFAVKEVEKKEKKAECAKSEEPVERLPTIPQLKKAYAEKQTKKDK